MMINLGALEKDRAGLDTGLLTIAKNCYPTTIGWGPMPTLSAFGSTSLPSKCKGLFFARTSTGGYQVFAGTTTKLYKLVSGTWTDYSRLAGGAYTTASGNYWQAAQWGSLLIVVNGSDAPQVIDIDSGAANFSALLGSPPTAIYISIVGDFVFMVDGTNRRRAVNCGTTGPNTATSWTVGTDLCDEYVAPDGGNITTPPMLGEYGLVIQDGGIARRIVLQPGDPTAAFRFEKIEGIKGCVGGYTAVGANNRIYYLAEDGVYSLDPSGSNVPVGSQRINEEFRATSDQSRLDQVQAFADPFSTRVYWAFYSAATATSFDRLLGYDWMLDRLFFVEATADYWAGIVMPGLTLEQVSAIYPNLDTMPVSLDSRQFIGGRPTLAAVNSSGALALLSGANANAVLRVSPTNLIPKMRAILTEAEIQGVFGTLATVELWIGKRENMAQDAVWAGPYTASAETGSIYPRVSSRVFQFELRISGEGWSSAQAIGTEELQDGKR